MRTLPVAGAAIAALLLSGTAIGSAAPAYERVTTAPAGQGGQPVEDPYYPGRSNPEIDVRREHLDLTWDGSSLDGTATVEFRVTHRTKQVRLDLIHALDVSSVELESEAIGFTHHGYGLVMQTGRLTPRAAHTLVITYAGTPHTVQAPSHRGDQGAGLGWALDQDGYVYTFQEPYGAYSWFPSNDHPSDKAQFSASVTVPDGQTAVFNGRLLAHEGNTWNWTAKRLMAPYLTTIAIGPYTAYHDTMSDGTPVTYWLLPRDESILTSLKSQTRDAFDWLTDHAGAYPFQTFGIVVTGGDSAMETQTLVTLSRAAFDRPDAVIEHEMAHEWYGDAVTPLYWQDVWLSEGWAMWMQQAYEVYRGGYRYLGGIDNWSPYDEAARQRSGPPGDWDPKSFGDLNVYLGPAMLLDKIRQRIGDEKFTNLSKAWILDFRYGNATRDDFTLFVDDYTGRDLSKLIHLWLDSEHTPPWP